MTITTPDVVPVTVAELDDQQICHTVCCLTPVVDGVPQVTVCGAIETTIANENDHHCVMCAAALADDICPHTGRPCPPD